MNIRLNLDKSVEKYEVIKVKQFDTMQNIQASFFENGIPLDLAGFSVSFECSKPDGTFVIDSTVSRNDNIATIPLPEQSTKVAGIVNCQFVLSKEGKQDTTFTFFLDVKRDAKEGSVESESVVTILEQLTLSIEEGLRVLNELKDEASMNDALQQISTHKSNTDIHINSTEKEQIEINKVNINNNYLEFDNHVNGPYHIVESGTNSNGSYIRFADGTQICNISNLTLTYLNSGSLVKGWVLPAMFKDTNYTVSATKLTAFYGAKASATLVARQTNRSSVNLDLIVSGTSFTNTDTLDASVMAIGRWK